jgi:hypothetical protein
MTAGDNSGVAPPEQNDNNAPRDTVRDAAVELPKHKGLLRSARGGAILSADASGGPAVATLWIWGDHNDGPKDWQAAA